MATGTTVKTPYSTAMLYAMTPLATDISEYDAQRLASYDLYDDLYDNSPDAGSAMLRVPDDRPILVPTAKRIINTMARYVGKNWGYRIDPAVGTAEDRRLAAETFGKLFARERILSQFANGKKEWLRRGDWLWMVYANPRKPEGRRISIKQIDPRTYFPIHDPSDLDRVTGCEIAEEILLDDGQTIAMQVQRWLRPMHPDHPFYDPEDPDVEEFISYESHIYKADKWSDPDKREILRTIEPIDVLDGIYTLPVYHVRNNYSTANPFGVSELSGLEGVCAAINQAITDEDTSLAISGLGQYVTDSGAPIDPETGSPTAWQLGPLNVVEIGVGRMFQRLGEIKTVQPVQDHVDYLEEHAYGTSGINDIALGTRGTVQESGVALAIRMAPLFDWADEKDLHLNDVMSQMFYDLANYWFPEYEGVDLSGVIVESVTDVGDRLPMNRAERWEELVRGYVEGLFTVEFVHKTLNEEFGYNISSSDTRKALEAAEAKANAADPFAQRVDAELNSPAEDDDADDDE